MKKKIISTAVTITVTVLASLLLCCTSKTFGAESAGAINIVIDGQTVSSSYKPVWNDGKDRIMIEQDFLSEYFGAEIESSNEEIKISKNNHILSLKNGADFIVFDGIGGRSLTSPIVIKDSKAYIALRYMCEAFGAAVDWDSNTNTASIKTNTVTLLESAKPYLENVQVFDQATIRITGEKTIYIDPRRIAGEPHDADIILITHTHGDHFEIDSIKKVMNEQTVIYITADGVEAATENGLTNIKQVSQNEEYGESGISIRTVPAYNTAATRQNHKLESGWVGYIVTLNGITYYAAGDTDFIDDMNNIETDVVFLPIDGRYNMDEVEAAKAANAINPKVAIPYHYNNFSTENKALDFIALLDKDIMGSILTFKVY